MAIGAWFVVLLFVRVVIVAVVVAVVAVAVVVVAVVGSKAINQSAKGYGKARNNYKEKNSNRAQKS